MENYPTLTFPIISWVWNSLAVDRIFRKALAQSWNRVLPEWLYVDVLKDDWHHTKLDWVMWTSEVCAAIATNVSLTLFWYSFFSKIHRPILLSSNEVPLHVDRDPPYAKRRELTNSIRKPWDALSILIPLRRQGEWVNQLDIWWTLHTINWERNPLTGHLFDQTVPHGIDGEEFKLYWVGLVHKKLYEKIRSHSEKMDKILKWI